MFKFSCILVNSASNAFRQLVTSVNTTGFSLYGSRGLPLQRAISSSAVRHQEAEASAANSGKDFSNFPPLPGQESSLRWAGKKFEELPIVHIKATYNNTHVQLTDSTGQSVVRTSCGTEGFKNIKKSTPIAAQTAGISAAAKATAKGVTFVRVVVKGLGPGRLSAIKGLTMGGLQVVSITDNTPVPHNGCRPRKARRTWCLRERMLGNRRKLLRCVTLIKCCVISLALRWPYVMHFWENNLRWSYWEENRCSSHLLLMFTHE